MSRLPNMTSIEMSLSARIAGELFDHVLVPMAAARQACGAPAYFAADRKGSSASYFVQPSLPTMGAADFELPGHGTAERVIEALVAFWERAGDSDLCCLGPVMREVAAALQSEAVENDGTVSVFCYAMF